MPKLNPQYLYVIAGDGPEKNNIQKIITQKKLQKRVFLLGKIDSETLKFLYNLADIFVMPNIKVKGDMEGFGIVALEAASYGLPVIASNIEGIKDAVLEGTTGFLIEEKNSFKFVEAIKKINLNREKIIKAVQNKFSWTIIAKQYQKIFS
jgi:glycosyltransferase involved in cell wall biosynthesis